MLAMYPLLYLSISTSLTSLLLPWPSLASPMHGNANSRKGGSEEEVDQIVEAPSVHAVRFPNIQAASSKSQGQIVSSSILSDDSGNSISGLSASSSTSNEPIEEELSAQTKIAVSRDLSGVQSKHFKNDHPSYNNNNIDSTNNNINNIENNNNNDKNNNNNDDAPHLSPTHPDVLSQDGSFQSQDVSRVSSLPSRSVSTTTTTTAYHLPSRIATGKGNTQSWHPKRHSHGSVVHPVSSQTMDFLSRRKRSEKFPDNMQSRSRPVISIKNGGIDLVFPVESFPRKPYADNDKEFADHGSLIELFRDRLRDIGLFPSDVGVEVQLPYVLGAGDDESEGRADEFGERTDLASIKQALRREDDHRDVIRGQGSSTGRPEETAWRDVDSNTVSKRGGRIFNYLRQMNGRMKDRRPLGTTGRSALSMRRPRLRHKSEAIVRRQPHRQPLPIFTRIGAIGYSSTPCLPESDGTKALTCPTAKDICVYDVMICDGKADCPDGEDEQFAVCVIRHWTRRFDLRLQNLETMTRPQHQSR